MTPMDTLNSAGKLVIDWLFKVRLTLIVDGSVHRMTSTLYFKAP